MKPKKIIIFSAYSYWGGTLVLSVLCKTLRELGYDARLYMTLNFRRSSFNRILDFVGIVIFNIITYLSDKIFGAGCLNRLRSSGMSSVNMPGLKFQLNPFFSRENTIIVYPESLYGNPLFGKHVVRWLLSNYCYENTPGAYSKEDFFVAYRNVFNSSKLNPQNNMLRIEYFDHNLYRQYNFEERHGTCYILRKGCDRTDLPSHFDGPVFDDNMTQKELVKMFNEYKYCYCYDTQTFYSRIAAVCGCIPIVVMEEGKTVRDYLGPDDNQYGVAYGDTPDQIKYAIETREQLVESLNFDEANREYTRNFVKLLKQRYGEIKRM